MIVSATDPTRPLLPLSSHRSIARSECHANTEVRRRCCFVLLPSCMCGRRPSWCARPPPIRRGCLPAIHVSHSPNTTRRRRRTPLNSCPSCPFFWLRVRMAEGLEARSSCARSTAWLGQGGNEPFIRGGDLAFITFFQHIKNIHEIKCLKWDRDRK